MLNSLIFKQIDMKYYKTKSWVLISRIGHFPPLRRKWMTISFAENFPPVLMLVSLEGTGDYKQFTGASK